MSRTLEVKADGVWKEVIRYDCSHDFAHKDCYNIKGQCRKINLYLDYEDVLPLMYRKFKVVGRSQLLLATWYLLAVVHCQSPSGDGSYQRVLSRRMPNLTMHTQKEIKNILERHFKEIADAGKIEAAFLYGSWARGCPKETSDVDVAVVFSETGDEDKVFEMVTNITLSLMKEIRLEVNIIPIFLDFRKPMLYYNAIVLGIPVFIREQYRYAALLNEAIFQMEDFSIFGVGWQLEVAGRNIKEVTRA